MTLDKIRTRFENGDGLHSSHVDWLIARVETLEAENTCIRHIGRGAPPATLTAIRELHHEAADLIGHRITVGAGCCAECATGWPCATCRLLDKET
jgi:hypothetical protein